MDEFSIHGSLNDGVVELSDFKIGLERGELTAYGEWNIADRSAELAVHFLDGFHDAGARFSGSAGAGLEPARFSQFAPVMTGRVLFDLHQGLHTDIQADLDWREFTFNGSLFPA